jgi:hypothetical protein
MVSDQKSQYEIQTLNQFLQVVLINYYQLLQTVRDITLGLMYLYYL